MKKIRIAFLLPLLVLSASFAYAQQTSLTILYTNDLHSHFEPHIVPWVDKDCKVGGVANIATLVKREKATNKNTIYVDAGNSWPGRM